MSRLHHGDMEARRKADMSVFLEVLIAVAAISLVGLFLRRLLRPGAPAEPIDDPFALVPATRKGGPKGRAAAVAIEEPDDDGPTDFFPPRRV